MGDKIERMPSGIQGLDAMIEGGFPFPSTILVAGPAGTGKTTFSMQFLCEGARNGEKCLYLSTYSESIEWMLKFVSRYEFINKNYFGKAITYVDLGAMIQEAGGKEILKTIEGEVMRTAPKRVVIDPMTVLADRLGGDYRSFLYDLATTMKNWQSVTILTGEIVPESIYQDVLAYISDGIILLYNDLEGAKRKKYLEVLKMRGTAHTSGKHRFDITSGGVRVYPVE